MADGAGAAPPSAHAFLYSQARPVRSIPRRGHPLSTKRTACAAHHRGGGHSCCREAGPAHLLREDAAVRTHHSADCPRRLLPVCPTSDTRHIRHTTHDTRHTRHATWRCDGPALATCALDQWRGPHAAPPGLVGARLHARMWAGDAAAHVRFAHRNPKHARASTHTHVLTRTRVNTHACTRRHRHRHRHRPPWHRRIARSLVDTDRLAANTAHACAREGGAS
jgi:hypothetical protein